MNNPQKIVFAFVGAGMIACASVAAIAFSQLTSPDSEIVEVSQSQQDLLDSYVEQM